MKRNFTNSSVCFAIAYNEIIYPGSTFFEIVFFEASNFTNATASEKPKKYGGCLVGFFFFLLFEEFIIEKLCYFFFFKNSIASAKALFFCQ